MSRQERVTSALRIQQRSVAMDCGQPIRPAKKFGQVWKTHRRGRRTGNGKRLIDWGKNGGRGRDRTYDQSIKSRMLYQLSYASNVGSPWVRRRVSHGKSRHALKPACSDDPTS